MYLAIDVGGTKTLLAVFDERGNKVTDFKFPTNHDYQQFKTDLAKAVASLGDNRFTHCCCAIPGLIDRDQGIAIAFGNLPWKNLPFKADLEALLGIPVLIENDANLAGLSEAHLVLKKYPKALYLTISTGIGDGFIVDGVIDRSIADSEPGFMMLEHDGKLQRWQDFASGKAIVARYGKRASEINDPAIWDTISKDLAEGMIDLIATLQPDVIIIGGGVGAHFHKFGTMLQNHLNAFKTTVVPIPPVIGAQRAEEAVIYGCYELIRQHVA